MVVLRAVKDIVSIKIKMRHDSYTDQFSRLFMTKVLLIASLIMIFDYFFDRVSCMGAKDYHLSPDFIDSVCWISGFYIYKEMTDPQKFPQSEYCGIPQKLDFVGIDQFGRLCETKDEFFTNPNPDCKKFTRIYYLHYQWMPLYIAALAVLYYLPYIGFRIVNVDLISLETEIKSLESDADKILKNYFNYEINPLSKQRWTVSFNICIKLLYIAANLFPFYFTDHLLHGNFIPYGREYLRWSNNITTLSHSPINIRLYAKPGKLVTGYFVLNTAQKMKFSIKNYFTFSAV